MLAACSRLHSAELRVEVLEVQRGMQRRRGQAARAAGWAGIMPRPFDASESSGAFPSSAASAGILTEKPARSVAVSKRVRTQAVTAWVVVNEACLAERPTCQPPRTSGKPWVWEQRSTMRHL